MATLDEMNIQYSKLCAELGNCVVKIAEFEFMKCSLLEQIQLLEFRAKEQKEKEEKNANQNP